MGTIAWSELGAPQTPATVHVTGLGRVRIDQKDINIAASLPGDPEFSLIDVTSLSSGGVRDFVLGSAG